MKFLKHLVCELNPEKAAAEIKQALGSTKIVHVTPGMYPADLVGFYYELSGMIGTRVAMEEDLATGHKTSEFWTDIIYSPDKPMSYRHSNKRQPLHTDGSYENNAPDISFFYCIERAKVGGATVFLDYDELIQALKLHDPQLLEQLQKIEIMFSKGGDWKERPVISSGKLTWNYFRAIPVGIESCTKTTGDLIEAFHTFLENVVVQLGICHPVCLSPGEAVFFWDETVLHGRDSFLGQRWLKKGGIKWTDAMPTSC